MNVLVEKEQKPPRVLIVDDSLTNLKILLNFFRSYGFEILTANDGETALKMVEEVLPDIILLDVVMPFMDGFETCQQLKSSVRTRDIPIIFMTGLADSIDKIKGLSLGAVDYITKPFNHEETLARIRIHLQLQQEIKERIASQEALQKLTEELEQKVEEKVAELSASQIELAEAKVQLMQTEKMSTLGELVAGVAHEINNPIGFIMGNINLAKEYCQSLIEHLGLYERKYLEPGEEIGENAEEIDLEFIKEDLPKILESLRVGAERVRQISVSLRTFSRADSHTKVSYNLHEGLDTTLMILQHRLKPNSHRPAIQVIKDYGDLPLISCYAGPINQVFMNLLSNSIDALDEFNVKHERSFTEIEKSPNQIRIGTRKIEPDWVEIRIGDNADGIADFVKQHLFESFITTKPVGKGTGLGLSISHSIIVKKHGGVLECFSSWEKGTEFVIKLPVDAGGEDGGD